MTVLSGVITLLNMLNVALCLPVLCELNWNKTLVQNQWIGELKGLQLHQEMWAAQTGGVGSVGQRGGQANVAK